MWKISELILYIFLFYIKIFKIVFLYIALLTYCLETSVHLPIFRTGRLWSYLIWTHYNWRNMLCTYAFWSGCHFQSICFFHYFLLKFTQDFSYFESKICRILILYQVSCGTFYKSDLPLWDLTDDGHLLLPFCFALIIKFCNNARRFQLNQHHSHIDCSIEKLSWAN